MQNRRIVFLGLLHLFFFVMYSTIWENNLHRFSLWTLEYPFSQNLNFQTGCWWQCANWGDQIWKKLVGFSQATCAFLPPTTIQWWHQHVTYEWRISSIELKPGIGVKTKRRQVCSYRLSFNGSLCLLIIGKVRPDLAIRTIWNCERKLWKNIAFEIAIPWLLHLMPHISNIWSSLHTR